MINVIGSNPVPPSPIPNDPTTAPASPTPVAANKIIENNPVLATNQKEEKTSSDSPNNKKPKFNKKKKPPLKYILGGLLLLILLIGGGASLYLTKINQDVRQQASQVYSCPAGSSNYGAAKCGPACAGDCFGPSLECCPGTGGYITPTTAPTDPPADPTDPPADPTDPPADPTDPPADPTDPPADPTDPPGEACTQDVEECSDGSFVSRDPDNDCEFMSCPIEPTKIADGGDNDDDGYSPTDGAVNQETGEFENPPTELPQTGPEDWLDYIKVGLGAIGIGAILLLFL